MTTDPRHPFTTHLRVELGSSENTIRAYLGDIDRFRRWLDANTATFGKPLIWTDVTEREIRSYLAHLATDRRLTRPDGATLDQPGTSPKTTHRVIASLRKWFDYLIDVEHQPINPNPARRIRKPKLPKRHPPALTPEQVTALITTAHQRSRASERVRNWTLIAFLYHTGLRVSELCSMRLCDVEFQHAWPRRLKVIGKGNKERTVILSPDPSSTSGEAARALVTWLHQRTMLLDQITAPTTDHVWLIPTGGKRGQPLTPPGVRAIFRSLSKRIGAKAYPHLMRHSFATHAVRNGARMDALQRVLGHASLATTGLYLHANEDDLLEVVASVPGRVGVA